MTQASLQGLRVLALESRRANEIAKLIRTCGGEPMVAPAVREVPLASNHEALKFASSLIGSEFDLVIFLTGSGVRILMDIVQTEYDRDTFLDALREVKIAARGPKPLSVLRELQVPVTVTAPEPCTWRELISALETKIGRDLEGMRIAVQEYGAPNLELLNALKERNCAVTRVPLYEWALPEDLSLLHECIRAIAELRIDIVLFTTGVQIIHLSKVAEQMHYLDKLYDGLNAIVILSIGPSTSEELRRYGIEPDFEPSHPKMGFLLNEAAQCMAKLLENKKSGNRFKKNVRAAIDPPGD